MIKNKIIFCIGVVITILQLLVPYVFDESDAKLIARVTLLFTLLAAVILGILCNKKNHKEIN
jgi:hypothetical protein